MKLSLVICCQIVLLLSGCARHLQVYNEALYDPKFVCDLKGHKISVVEPASGTDQESLSKIKQIKAINLCFHSACQENTSPFHSQEDFFRLTELSEAFRNQNSKIIWSLRGGYGSARLIPELIKKPHILNNKILIGYSDITALHLLLNRQGIMSIHGPMVGELLMKDKSPKNFVYLANIFNPRTKCLLYAGITPLNRPAQCKLESKGTLVGGNLALISSSIGTSWQIVGDNKIIVIEDVGVKGYAIDRSLTQLKQAHVFDKAKAILFGEFTKGDECIDYALTRFANEMKIPVYKASFFGHGKDNYPLIFGSTSRICRNSLCPETGFILEMKIPKTFKYHPK